MACSLAAVTSSSALRGPSSIRVLRRAASSSSTSAPRRGVAVVPKAAAAPATAPGVKVEAASSVQFEAPNQYGYFDSAIEAAEIKRAKRLEEGYTSIKGLSADEEASRYARLCSKHPTAQRCQEGFTSKIVTKPATQSMINGSMVRSDGIILVPGNREDLITWALDPKMSGDTLGKAILQHKQLNASISSPKELYYLK